MANECIPLFRPGGDITCQTTGAVTGCTFVDVSATIDATTGLIKVTTAAAGAKAFGVAVKDAASGDRVPVITGPGQVVPVFARATIAFGAEVEVGGTGGVITLASGKAVGKAVAAGTNGNLIFVKLY